jgi:hypothetical protein
MITHVGARVDATDLLGIAGRHLGPGRIDVPTRASAGRWR